MRVQPRLMLNPNIFNKIEQIDSQTYKRICKQCGGKTIFIHQNYNMTTKQIDKQEIVSCNCEGGFIYGSN